MAVTYTAPQYDDKKYREGINTDYYTQAIENYKQQAEQNRATQLGEAQKTQQSALRQAYITRVQNQQKLNQSLAQHGIRGGATETANLGLANQYGQERGVANTNYTNSVNEINKNIDQNSRDYQSDMDSRAEEYRQNQANARWQADREDSLNEYNSELEYWNNYYTDFYSGYSNKNANKAYKDLKNKLAKATSDSQKRQIEMAIRGVKARLGAIANK